MMVGAELERAFGSERVERRNVELKPVATLVRRIDEARTSLTPPSKPNLDVGCGSGSEYWTSQKSNVIGCDLSLLKLKIAKKLYDGVVYCDARFLPFKPKSFKLVTAFDVIEHLKKPDALKLLDRLETLTDGAILLSTPARWYQGNIADLYPLDPLMKHLCFISAAELEARGYKIVEKRHYLHLPFTRRPVSNKLGKSIVGIFLRFLPLGRFKRESILAMKTVK